MLVKASKKIKSLESELASKVENANHLSGEQNKTSEVTDIIENFKNQIEQTAISHHNEVDFLKKELTQRIQLLEIENTEISKIKQEQFEHIRQLKQEINEKELKQQILERMLEKAQNEYRVKIEEFSKTEELLHKLTVANKNLD